MKKILFLFPFLICSLLYAEDPLQNFVDSISKSYLGNGNGALVIGVDVNGKSELFYYGHKSVSDLNLPDSMDLFEIGDITETFTDVLLADQVIRGNISIDGRLQDYLNRNVPAPVYQPMVCRPIDDNLEKDENPSNDNLKIKFKPIMCLPDSSIAPQPILLCYLATHVSGYPDLPSNLHPENKSQPLADYSQKDLYNFLATYKIERPIGFEYKHSRLGIALLAEAITVKMKKDYEALLIENVLNPLGMFSTRLNIALSQKGKLLQGYDKKGQSAPLTNFLAFAPALGLHINSSDMMRFLAANISLSKDHIVNALDYTHNPRLRPQNGSKNVEIGLGWKISNLDEKLNKMVWQGGMTSGFASFVGFVEPKHLGVFVLSSKAKETDKIGEELVRYLLRN